jgi:hypothetical protein
VGCYDKPVCRTGPPGYIGWRNRILGIDSWLLERLQTQALSPDLLEAGERVFLFRRENDRNGSEYRFVLFSRLFRMEENQSKSEAKQNEMKKTKGSKGSQNK